MDNVKKFEEFINESITNDKIIEDKIRYFVDNISPKYIVVDGEQQYEDVEKIIRDDSIFVDLSGGVNYIWDFPYIEIKYRRFPLVMDFFSISKDTSEIEVGLFILDARMTENIPLDDIQKECPDTDTDGTAFEFTFQTFLKYVNKNKFIKWIDEVIDIYCTKQKSEN